MAKLRTLRLTPMGVYFATVLVGAVVLDGLADLVNLCWPLPGWALLVWLAIGSFVAVVIAGIAADRAERAVEVRHATEARAARREETLRRYR